MTYLKSAKAATDNKDFKLRVVAALYYLARDVVNESPDVTNHVWRYTRAKDIMAQPEIHVHDFLWVCSTNSTIVASMDAEGSPSATDSEIQYVVNSHFEIMSQNMDSAT